MAAYRATVTPALLQLLAGRTLSLPPPVAVAERKGRRGWWRRLWRRGR